MPVSREELEEGRIDLTFPIVRILVDNPNLGLSAEEIQLLLLETDGRDAQLADVEWALELLVQRDRVQMGEIEDQQWYTLVQRRLGFRTER